MMLILQCCLPGSSGRSVCIQRPSDNASIANAFKKKDAAQPLPDMCDINYRPSRYTFKIVLLLPWQKMLIRSFKAAWSEMRKSLSGYIYANGKPGSTTATYQKELKMFVLFFSSQFSVFCHFFVLHCIIRNVGLIINRGGGGVHKRSI